MHVADSVLSPTVCAAAGAVSLGAVGYSLHRLKGELLDRTIPLTGMMSALIFAGQMVNFPLVGLPVSGHLMGGVLAAVVLGPWAGLVCLTLVLAVQCLLFADGGLMALGVNILHMGVIGAWGGYAVARSVSGFFRNRTTGVIVGAVAASWLSVVAASTLFSLEFWYSWRGTEIDFTRILSLMAFFHSLIGVGEALITAGILSQVLQLRPDLVRMAADGTPAESAPLRRFLVGGCVAALAVAAFLAPFASSHPDGLEAVAEQTAFDDLAQPTRIALLDDYAVPAPLAAWESQPWWQVVSVGLAGIGGTLAVLAIAWMYGRVAVREANPPGAAS